MKYNVIIYDFNSKEFITYDIIPYLFEQYIKCKNKPSTFDEFKKFIKEESMYQFWARCEYEIILLDWPGQSINKKIDVYYQILINIDIITELFIKHVNNIK